MALDIIPYNTMFRFALINAINPAPKRDGKRFTTFEMAEGLSIKRTRLQEWIDGGYIVPVIRKAKGKGTKALFNNQDIYYISMFHELVNFGLTRYMAARVIRERKALDRSKPD